VSLIIRFGHYGERISADEGVRAVMDGRNNLANQEVFRMARAADPTGSRTVGVVTKCDALQPGEEGSVSSPAPPLPPPTATIPPPSNYINR